MRALLLVAIVGIVAVGCGGSTDEDAAAPVGPYELTDPPSSTNASPADDRPAAPPIEGTTLEGDRMALSDFRGRPVLVNVWSSW